MLISIYLERLDIDEPHLLHDQSSETLADEDDWALLGL
jgi:hypothetical protein